MTEFYCSSWAFGFATTGSIGLIQFIAYCFNSPDLQSCNHNNNICIMCTLQKFSNFSHFHWLKFSIFDSNSSGKVSCNTCTSRKSRRTHFWEKSTQRTDSPKAMSIWYDWNFCMVFSCDRLLLEGEGVDQMPTLLN